MKKQKYYLAAGVLACSAISGLAMPLANTFALDPGSYTQEVTVGEVDETIYSVDINWGDMTFDWKYNAITNNFDFEPHHPCQAILYRDDADSELDEAKSAGKIYSDEHCSSLETGDLIGGSVYYWLMDNIPGGQISVDDRSINGRVSVSASFTSEDAYNWVIGKFGVWTTDGGGNSPTGDYYLFNEFSDGIFPQTGVIYNSSSIIGRSFSGSLKLEKNSQSQIPFESISSDDKIGTVTLTISPDTTPIDN